MKSVRLTENYEIRRFDSMNWRMYVRRKLKKGERAGDVDWVPQQAYFGTIEAALMHLVHDHALNGDDEERDVKSAIRSLRSLEREIAAHAAAFSERRRGVDGEIADVDIDGEVLD